MTIFLGNIEKPSPEGASESNIQRPANQAETKMNKSKKDPENNVESLDLATLKLVYP